MRQFVYYLCGILLLSISGLATADVDSYQNAGTATPQQIEQKQKDLLQMADDTLARLYSSNPDAKQVVESAYGYGVFEGQVVNLLLYVGGTGMGVVFDNKTKTPVFMRAVRAGTGPGVGYKSLHGIIVFDNETVYEQFTTIGLQIGASADAALTIDGKGAGIHESASLVPGVSTYVFTDTGIVVQANWGATEFLKDSELNGTTEQATGG